MTDTPFRPPSPPDRELDRYRLMLRSTPFAVVIYEGPQHVATFSNLKHDEMVGGRVILGQPLLASLPELAGQSAIQRLDEVFRTGETLSARELPVRLMRNGILEEGWFDLTWQALRNPDGTSAGVVVTALEVTSHIQTRKRLEAAELKFATMLDRAPFPIALLRVPSFVIAETNQAWVDFFGFSRAEAVGKTSAELFREQDLAARNAHYKTCLETGTVRDFETTVVDKSGVPHVVINNMDRIELDGEAFILGTFEDLTPVRKHEAAVRRSDAQFRALVDNLPELAWSADPTGYIDYYNSRWYEYTGTTFEEMQGWGWNKVHDPEMLPKVTARWTHSVSTGEPFEMEFPLRRADGAFRWFLTRVRPLRDADGKILRWFGTNTDTHDQKLVAADLALAVSVRDDFLSIAGHELRTPLAAMLMHIQSLERTARKEAGAPRVLERLEKAAAAGMRLDALVSQLLDVSRIQAGRMGLEPRRTDLVALVTQSVQRHRDGTATQNITIQAPAELVGVWDPERLHQVFANLLSNALKYGRGSPIEVGIEAQAGHAVVRVTDHGIGIPPEAQQRIFQRFERAALSADYGGIGLGLWIARQIVDASGGRIEVTSERGLGSTFTVTLPLTPPTEARDEAR